MNRQGGGLEPGEGTIDCLKREAVEEFGQKIEIIEHFYTTDFYQKALFYEDTQLISIYYTVKFSAEIQFKISTKKFDFDINKNQNQSFRWVLISDLDINEISYPIDKKVAWMLKGKYS